MRFVMVDRILEMVPGESVLAEKTLSPDEELFRDHFPGFPVVPGVLLTEMMAQAAGKCLNAPQDARGLPVLLEIRNARFRQWVKPGETVSIHAKILSNSPAVARASARILVAGKPIASSDLVFAFQPRSSFAADYRDAVLEAFLSAADRNGAAS
jgi:3-hydroxyacyl-[acyl-carrier-protein] dehydratase